MTHLAYGLLEVRGLVTGLEAADAMLKSAQVRLVVQRRTNPAYISLLVEGDIGACRAAVDAGAAAAKRLGTVVAQAVIGRPDADLERVFGAASTTRLPPSPPQSPPPMSSTGPASPRRRRNRK